MACRHIDESEVKEILKDGKNFRLCYENVDNDLDLYNFFHFLHKYKYQGYKDKLKYFYDDLLKNENVNIVFHDVYYSKYIFLF